MRSPLRRERRHAEIIASLYGAIVAQGRAPEDLPAKDDAALGRGEIAFPSPEGVLATPTAGDDVFT
jgi:hypothetical protein